MNMLQWSTWSNYMMIPALEHLFVFAAIPHQLQPNPKKNPTMGDLAVYTCGNYLPQAS